MEYLNKIAKKAYFDELQKIAKGKYPIVEDDLGRTLVSGGSVAVGGAAGHKIGKTIKKIVKRRGKSFGRFGAAAGALGGAILHNKIKGK